MTAITTQYLFSSISIVFASMVIGAGINQFIKKKNFYQAVSNLQFIKKEVVYKIIGIKLIKWLVYKTFWKNFNQHIKMSSIKPSLSELHDLKSKMTDAEISHLIAFTLVIMISVGCFLFGRNQLGIILFVLNILFNLYPALLQQKHKQRIDRIIEKK